MDDLLNVVRGEAEGGCGVIGIACVEKILGKHLLPALCQMANRGNGKGGGIAAVGLSAEAFGVTQEVLEKSYLLAIAYLDLGVKVDLEKRFIEPLFDLEREYSMPHISSYKTIKDLDVAPPEVVVYFVKVKSSVLEEYRSKRGVTKLSDQEIEDQIVYENSYSLNKAFYSATGDKRAFVLSNGKNMLVLKLVGFAEDVIEYYQLQDFKAHVWIGHHRYPTKGNVWHPGGAHPFVGLNEALVHNGDFANYYSICEYLAQKDIHPLFLTDTEVSALLFDLLFRRYNYPLEYVIEALAPTTERDFTLLPKVKQQIYKQIQTTHMHGSPDGPWFFLIAQSLPAPATPVGYRLIGITDTSMLRPQVFALQNGHVPIGFAASEKQAIDATLKSLSVEDNRFWTAADSYWNARGGSYTDGGAFSFTVSKKVDGTHSLVCQDKFGQLFNEKPLKPPYLPNTIPYNPKVFPDNPSKELFQWVKDNIKFWDYQDVLNFLTSLRENPTDAHRKRAIGVITRMLDSHYPIGEMRRSCLTAFFNQALVEIFEDIKRNPSASFVSLGSDLKAAENIPVVAVIDATGFAPQGDNSLALELVRAHKLGYHKFILYNCSGHRFIGNGFGPNTRDIQIHVYGSSGDYLASGIDGAEIIVHGSGQDQLAQIMNSGSLVVYGDVGQTFMYGAKGGAAYILGNTAGRPLINAVGSPKVIINGTSLDYLAESFMAGNPLKGGGFAILNGITFDDQGAIVDLQTPYPGGNLFSLASGGAIYIRDPDKKVDNSQLNAGEFVDLTQQDWDLILPYLEENSRLFDIPVSRLLEHHGETLSFAKIYRKIRPAHNRALQEEEAWVKGVAP